MADNPKYLQEDWLREQYIEKGRTLKDIAEDTPVTFGHISKQIRKFGIDTRDATDYFRAETKANDADWLRYQYVVLGKSQKQIVQEVDVSRRTIGRRLDEHGIEKSDENPKLDSEEWLYHQYYNLHKSTSGIASEVGVSRMTVIRRMKSFDIPRRDPKEALEYVDQSGANNPMWRGGSGLRNSPEYRENVENVLERDDYTCQDCGKRGGRLNVHHIVPVHEDESLATEPENCVTLCPECHYMRHKKSGDWFAEAMRKSLVAD